MISNIGAGFTMAASAVYGAKTLVATSQLFWQGVTSIVNRTSISARYDDFHKGTIDSKGFLAVYVLPAPSTSSSGSKGSSYTNTLYSIVKYAAISGVLLEAGFRLADSPATVVDALNGGAKFLSPMRIANETMLTVFKSIHWSALWSRS